MAISALISWASTLLSVTKQPRNVEICPAWDFNGAHVIRWIELISGQCVYGPLGAVSWCFGYLSLLSWLCAQFPQIITNYQNHSVDGLSPVFLLNWFLGDATNLLGCILTHQLPFQTMLACYFVLVDGILVFQYIFYKILFPPRPYTLTLSAGSNFHPHPPPRAFTPPTTTHPIIINRINPNREFQRTVVSIAITLGFISMVAAEPAEPIPADDTSSIIGQVLAWVCCGLYLSSRMPQIRENHRRKSTQGLNIILFLAALSGNVFYTIGILTDPSAHNLDERKDFLMNALPYILGSAGTILFDVTILMQWVRYFGREPVEIDREAIKRYLTTDESWLSNKWIEIRNWFQFPWSISIHSGPYSRQTDVLEGVDPNSESSDDRLDKYEAERRPLLNSASRSYGGS